MVDTRIRAHAVGAAERVRGLHVVFPCIDQRIRRGLADWLELQVSADAVMAASRQFATAAAHHHHRREVELAEAYGRVSGWLLLEALEWPGCRCNG